MAHLGLRLAPIGEGKYKGQTSSNSSSDNEEVWEIPLDDFGLNKIPVGDERLPTNRNLSWANNPKNKHKTKKIKATRKRLRNDVRIIEPNNNYRYTGKRKHIRRITPHYKIKVKRRNRTSKN